MVNEIINDDDAKIHYSFESAKKKIAFRKKYLQNRAAAPAVMGKFLPNFYPTLTQFLPPKFTQFPYNRLYQPVAKSGTQFVSSIAYKNAIGNETIPDFTRFGVNDFAAPGAGKSNADH
ncbi:MAG: hypothetical protein LBG47_07615 [Prevotellaceae bacterium]|jgi:hypothetical protein|nr:hypothetical protein [Prevotellaceae bacterium]